MIVMGFGLRLAGLGRAGFAEDEINKLDSIVTETPGVVRYYTEEFGRTDLQSRVLSDPKYNVSATGPAYVILQPGRTYFENQNEMKEVRDRFTLVYAGCVEGHTAAEVYAVPANPTAAVEPCGDLRPYND
jgi:hypothetical protein